MQRKVSIIGQEKQSFAGIIQSPHGIDDLPLLRQQIIDSRAVVLIFLGTDTTLGLVQNEVEFFVTVNLLAVHGHLVARRINFGTEQPHRMTVHRHPAVHNELLRGAPRGHARFREKFLQANHDGGERYEVRGPR